MPSIESLKDYKQIEENPDKEDNPFLPKEEDIMLNELNDKDRIILQKKLTDLSTSKKSLHLNYSDNNKRLEDLNSFQEKLNDLILYIKNIYILIKGGQEIKNINELDIEKIKLDKKSLSNFNLEIDFNKIDDFTCASRKSLLSLFSACENLRKKIIIKEKELTELTIKNDFNKKK